jgi:hypothetical protein
MEFEIRNFSNRNLIFGIGNRKLEIKISILKSPYCYTKFGGKEFDERFIDILRVVNRTVEEIENKINLNRKIFTNDLFWQKFNCNINFTFNRKNRFDGLTGAIGMLLEMRCSNICFHKMVETIISDYYVFVYNDDLECKQISVQLVHKSNFGSRIKAMRTFDFDLEEIYKYGFVRGEPVISTNRNRSGMRKFYIYSQKPVNEPKVK